MKTVVFVLTILIYKQIIYGLPLSSKNEIQTENDLNYIKIMREKTKFRDYIEKARNTFDSCHILDSYKDKKISSDAQCIDPSEEEMTINIVRLTLTFKELSGVLDLNSIQNIYKDYIITRKQKIMNSPKCKLLKNVTEFNEMSICPWHTHVISRQNIYPSIISNAVCNCGNCQKINTEKEDVEYKCRPVYRLSPALIRKENCNPITGIYEWTPVLEKISVACVCANTTPKVLFT